MKSKSKKSGKSSSVHKSKELRVQKDKKIVVPDKESALSKEERRKMKKIMIRVKTMKSTFKKHIPKIYRLIEENNLALTASAMQKGMLMMITELMPITEHNVRKYGNERAVYALNALVSQSREILADMKAENDSGALASKICDEVVREGFLGVGQNLAQALYHLREELKPYVREQHYPDVVNKINAMAKEMSGYANGQFQQTRERIFKYMVL